MSSNSCDLPQGPDLPADITLEEMEIWLDRIALEIVALKDEGYKLVPWFEWLEGQILNRRIERTTLDRAKARVAGKTAASAVTLDDMIPHDVVLERYPWLSAQILNRWRREQQIRSLRGRDGATVYSRSELERALDAELRFDDPPEPRVKKPPPPPNQQFVEEADRIRERLYMEQLANRRKQRKPRPKPG